ncbi:MAG: hypothetical protein KGN79_09725 [Acidobacteriota bacterium]|nr:hypothetical protein [Acidobacteriota bacterium]
MRAFTRVDLTCSERSNELAFTTLRHDGWVELYALPAFAVLVVCLFWIQGSLFTRSIAVFAACIAAISTLALRLQGREATLRVRQDEIVAYGNLGRWFQTATRIPVRAIQSLHFSTGQEGEHSGIYVSHGWRRTCVMPRIEAEQAATILGALHHRFPTIPIGVPDSTRPISRRILASLHLLSQHNDHASRMSAGD